MLVFFTLCRVHDHSPGGWRVTNPCTAEYGAPQRVPVRARSIVSKRSPATTMNAWPWLAKTVTHLPGPALPQDMNDVESIWLLSRPADASANETEPEQS